MRHDHVSCVIVLPWEIGDLPPLLASAVCARRHGFDVHVVAASSLNETVAFLTANNIVVHLAAQQTNWRSRLDRAKAIVKTTLLFRRVTAVVRPDVIWYFGHWSLLASIIARAKRHQITVYTAPEVLSELLLPGMCQEYIARRAHHVIVAEENRKWLLKLSSGSKARFWVVPNRPLEEVTSLSLDESEGSAARVAFIGNGGDTKCTKFFIYQGYFGKSRCLDVLARAFLRLQLKEFGLILLGEYNRFADPLQLSQYMKSGRIVHVNKIAPPLHLQLSMGCHAGIMLYAPEGLNNIYCAPNKLFEYPMLGLPMVMPDYPGLRALNERFHIGVHCDPTEEDSILSALEVLAGHERSYWTERLRQFLLAMPKTEDLYAALCDEWVHQLSRLVPPGRCIPASPSSEQPMKLDQSSAQRGHGTVPNVGSV